MKFIVVGVFLLNLCAITLSIKCFVCNSMVDEECMNPSILSYSNEEHKSNETLDTFLVDCNSTAPEGAEQLCRMVETYVIGYNSMGCARDSTRVQRECGYKLRDGSLDYVKRQEDYELYVYQCNDKDGCNAAPQSNAFNTALLLAPFVIYRYM